MSNSTMQRPVPDNEQQRLTAVRSCEIFDTAPEAEFDAIARLAARLFEAPVAYVSMMDSDRLWLKAQVGLEIQQLDREVAICAHTLIQAEPLVVTLAYSSRHQPLRVRKLIDHLLEAIPAATGEAARLFDTAVRLPRIVARSDAPQLLIC